MTQPIVEPTADIELAELAATIEAAAARLLQALGHFRPAWTNITNGLPGLRSTTAEHTPPEDFASILNDDAYKALTTVRAAAAAALHQATTIRDQALHWATPDERPRTKPKLELDMWCTSCLRVERCSPIFSGELCRWCYEFNQIEHQRPPIRLLKAHHTGIRITAAMVDAELGINRKKKRA
jgi:hypothetical protein